MVDIPSPYNAIVGQEWVYRMKGVVSTLHQVIKVATPKGVETLYGDHIATRQCYLDTMKTKAVMEIV